MANNFEYRVTPLPSAWPGKATPSYQRRRAPFKSVPGRALTLLGREINMLRGKNVRIAIDVDESRIRQDGMLYSNARARTPAVIVSFDVSDGTLQFPCDTFTFWEANVDAIARALEALRMVDRYGVQQGRQYTGFKAIPASTGPTMNAETAAVVLSNYHATIDYNSVLKSWEAARDCLRAARAKVHPDAGGSEERWHNVEVARKVLSAHHGRAI